MAASLWTTGPCHLYIGYQGGATKVDVLPRFFYLGTAKIAPVITLEPCYRTFHADGQNQPLPADKALIGEQAFITALLTRWDESVYAQIANLTNQFAGTRGTLLSTDVGTMLLAESQTYVLFVQFPNWQNPSYAPNMPPGYLFYAAVLQGPHELDPLGTEARGLLLTWNALPVVTGETSYVLYSATATPPVPPPT